MSVLKVRGISDLIVATSIKNSDDPIYNLCKKIIKYTVVV